jgi:hypothetical protein
MENENCFSLNIVFFFAECSGLLGHRARLERILTAPQLAKETVCQNFPRVFFYKWHNVKRNKQSFLQGSEREFFENYQLLYLLYATKFLIEKI